MQHYITKYWENDTQYAEAWIQLNIFGRTICLWRKRIVI